MGYVMLLRVYCARGGHVFNYELLSDNHLSHRMFAIACSYELLSWILIITGCAYSANEVKFTLPKTTLSH